MTLSRKAFRLICARNRAIFREHYFQITVGIVGTALMMFFLYTLLAGDAGILGIAGEIWVLSMAVVVSAASAPALLRSFRRWKILALFPLDLNPGPKAAKAYADALQFGLHHGCVEKTEVPFQILSVHGEVQKMQFLPEDIVSPQNAEVFRRFLQAETISNISCKDYVLLNAMFIGISNHTPTKEQVDLFDKHYEEICQTRKEECLILNLYV